MARNFPGSSTTDYLKTGSAAVLNFNTNICWWAVIKVAALPSNFSVIGHAGVGFTRGSALAVLVDGRLAFDKTGVGFVHTAASPVLSTGVWYAVQAASTSEGPAKFQVYSYADHALVTTETPDTSFIFSPSTDPLVIGNLDTPLSANCFNGTIDRLALLQATPSDAEFLYWVRSGRLPRHLMYIFYAILWDASPTGDLSGNGNNLTVTGTTSVPGAPLPRFTQWVAASVVDPDIAAPQVARPTVDTTRDAWVDHAAGTTAIYEHLTEEVPDDATYIVTTTGPSSDVYVTKLSPVTDPATSHNHMVRYRYAHDTGSAPINLTVQLRQGYANEGSLGILIAEWIHSAIPVGTFAANQTLTTAQAENISDYTDLYIRLVADQP